MLHVAIVDDDPWVRKGRANALEETGAVTIVHVSDHDEALARPSWSGVDVALVDAHDPEGGFDLFLGVRVVQRIRTERSSEQTRIVVLTGHVSNDVLRLRMAEAGADLFYHHGDVRTVDDLLAVAEGRSPTPSPGPEEARSKLGLPRNARVNDAVSWAEEHLGDALDGRGDGDAELSRRRRITARQRIAGMTGLEPAAPPGPTDRRLPEWQEVVRFLRKARGVERRS